MIFNTISELLNQAKKDCIRNDVMNWLENETNLNDVLKTISHDYRWVCLHHGYEQFIDDCNFELFSDGDWDYLLEFQPQFKSFRKEV